MSDPRERLKEIERRLRELRTQLDTDKGEVEALEREKRRLDQSLAQSDSAINAAETNRTELEGRRVELDAFVSKQLEALGPADDSPLGKIVAAAATILCDERVALAREIGFGDEITAEELAKVLTSVRLAEGLRPMARYWVIKKELGDDAAARTSLQTANDLQSFLVSFATSVGSELDRLSEQQAAITVALEEGRRAYAWYLLKYRFSIGAMGWRVDAALPMPDALGRQLDTQLDTVIQAERSAVDAADTVRAADKNFAKKWDRLIELVFDGERVLAEQLKSVISDPADAASSAPSRGVTTPARAPHTEENGDA